ncbi:hypothetical protein [Hyalangium minutum]|uniref:hypothetical protein n=1 Tax=Hyalangium minutum TaxID=394096 RepID=UPI0005C528D7|nr:hypothetical protein [Hyalangium minutum]
MSLWGGLRDRLFGKPGNSAQVSRFDIEPGLSVLFTRHRLSTQQGLIDCCSYVTEGLAEHRQKEMVLTLRETAEVKEDAFRQRVFSAFSTFKHFAAQGRTVDVGDVTSFGERRPFPGRQFLYAAASPMPGVPVPQGALAVMLITDKELEIYMRCGAARVFASLGKALGYYPHPSWSDLHRAELPASLLEESLLPKVPSVHMWSARVVQTEGDLVLRVAPGSHEHFRKLFEQLPGETQPFAFLTGMDAAANACLVWEKGQSETSAITPPGSRAERISGCFLMILPGVEPEGVKQQEDGYVWCLSEASFQALKRALCEEQALALLVEGWRLRVEWLAP